MIDGGTVPPAPFAKTHLRCFPAAARLILLIDRRFGYILFTQYQHLYAQSRLLHRLSRSFGAKIAYKGEWYSVTQNLLNKRTFLQASLTNVILYNRYRVNSSNISAYVVNKGLLT